MSDFKRRAEKVYENLPESPRWLKGPAYHQLRTYGSTRARSARLPVTIAAFIVSGIMFVLFSGTAVSYLSTPSIPPSDAAPGHVHLLVPASAPDVNLCKVMVSGAILGYPAPKTLNWGKRFTDNKLVSGGSHIAKINGVSQYLESLGPEQDDDLILMVDGYDIWFQLRPQTLLDRYFDINRRANERIRNELGSTVMRKNRIEQSIVFSSQKRCWPGAADSAPCYAVPESSLPADIFGPGTDTDIGDKKNPYIKFRPRYLNSGVIIGTAGAMRLLFAEAVSRANEDPNFGSDQNIFSGIFGDQEVYREVLRQGDMSWWEKAFSRFWPSARDGRMMDKDMDRMRHSTKRMEFGIGLDYESSIGMPTVFNEDDTEWVNFNDQDHIDWANKFRHIKPADSRLRLSEDIATSVPPFQSNGSDSLPTGGWSDVSFFTSVWTGVTPAVIHHNAHRDNMKNLRKTLWDRIWFQKYARVMMDAEMETPSKPIAFSNGRSWVGADERKGGASDDVGNWMPYQTMCNGTDQEVFRDGKGPWEASHP